MQVSIPEPKLWSPDSPHLYGVDLWIVDVRASTLAVGSPQEAAAIDHVQSYAAMRKVSLGKDRSGALRIMLNDVFVFNVRPLPPTPGLLCAALCGCHLRDMVGTRCCQPDITLRAGPQLCYQTEVLSRPSAAQMLCQFSLSPTVGLDSLPVLPCVRAGMVSCMSSPR